MSILRIYFKTKTFLAGEIKSGRKKLSDLPQLVVPLFNPIARQL
jgi:hypothetical protein